MDPQSGFRAETAAKPLAREPHLAPASTIPASAIRSLTQHRRILRGDADGTLALLRESCVIDHKECIVCADHPVCLTRQFQTEWSGVPYAIANGMMETIVLSRS